MNNEQFRRLVSANSVKQPLNNGSVSPPASSGAGGRPAALGSRLKSSIPMTPRSVAGPSASSRADFARQLAERNRAFEKSLEKNNSNNKKARTSAPKGTRFAAGYVDRAKTRQEQQDEQDERAERLRALEESLKKGEIDQATYERLQGEIAGGDLSSTHLVKGLDFKLLERIRRGEDVTKPKEVPAQPEPSMEEEEEDPDAILERLESAEVKAIERERVEKKGQIATTTLNPGQKRTRAQIIAELKAAREAAKAKQQQQQPESTLGSRFKKIGAKQAPGTRIERDSRGREVMIIVDEDGHERRKIRKVDPKLAEQEEKKRRAEELAKMKGGVLGMEVPEFYRKQLEAERLAQEEKDKEITIFDDVESDYDPLAGLENTDSESDEKSGGEDGEVKSPKEKEKKKKKKEKEDAESTSMPQPPPPAPGGGSGSSAAPRNWFKDSKAPLTSQEEYKAPSLNDPSFLAALQKAKAVAAATKSEEEQMAAEREARLRKKLAESNRDDEDLDLGFGSSRVEDEADLRGDKVKMSEWRDRGTKHEAGDADFDDGDDDYADDGGGGGGKGKRKRKDKKKKGDKNNFADVMRVIERNKKGGS